VFSYVEPASRKSVARAASTISPPALGGGSSAGFFSRARTRPLSPEPERRFLVNDDIGTWSTPDSPWKAQRNDRWPRDGGFLFRYTPLEAPANVVSVRFGACQRTVNHAAASNLPSPVQRMSRIA